MNNKERLVSAYPKVFHMAQCGSWPNIRKYGLLSTTALLDLFQMTGEERSKIESQWRPYSIQIKHPKYGKAVVRDQKPARPDMLKKVLVDVTPTEWYKFLNCKVFFWLSEDSLKSMLNSPSYRNSYHDVITIDTRLLVERYLDQITLCPINSGFALFGRGERNFAKFQRVEDYPLISSTKAPRELSVEYGITEIAELVISVDRWRGTEFLKTIWER